MKAIESARPTLHTINAMLTVPAIVPQVHALIGRARAMRRRRSSMGRRALETRDALIGSVALAALLAGLGAAVVLSSRRRARSGEAEDARTRITEALLSQSTVAGLPIGARVRVPLWWRSPVIVEIIGPVPTAEVRDAVWRMVTREAGHLQIAVALKDRIVVDPSQFEHGHLEVIPG